MGTQIAGTPPPASASPSAGRITARAGHRRVALVLGSGGARGYAHIGVIEALTARGYEIVAISGTSMGAVVGGIHAAGRLAEYRAWVESIDTMALLRLLDPAFRLGAIQGDKVFRRIRELIGDVMIEDLPIEFTAVATDLRHQQEVWFRHGSLNLAMRASAAIPSLFTPVVVDGRTLVDGALLNPLPITPVLSSRSDLIIAVNLNGPNSARYQLPPVERPPAMRERLESFVASLESRLRLRRTDDAEGVLAEALGEVPGADLSGLPSDVPAAAGAAAASASGSATGSRPRPLTTPAGSAPAAAPGGDDDEAIDAAWTGPASALELINLSLEVMQNALTQYKIAGHSPHVLINVPKRICRPFEFYRAPDLIAIGRQIANDTLDTWERGHPIR
jgi:NTE family protein